MKTITEVQDEIAALKKLKPVPSHATKVQQLLDLAVDVLRDDFDNLTTEEWGELSQEEQEIAQEAMNWKRGLNKNKPSEGWGDLVIP